MSSNASVVLPPPGSPVMAMAVGPVQRRGEQRIEVHDGPGPAEGLADIRADPALTAVGGPVTQVHGGGRHAARDRVQRLALHVGAQPDPVPGQRLAQQRELVTGGVDHVDADVPVVLDDRLDPAHAQSPGSGAVTISRCQP